MESASPGPDSRPPRGALVIVAIGLLACLVAAVATTGKDSGEAAHLEWVQIHKGADSKAASVPGGGGTMKLTNVDIRSTGTNVSGYALFRTGATLEISQGSPVGGGRILCTVQSHQNTEIARSSEGLRTTYPRSSENGIYKQEVSETILVDFSSHSSELAVLEVADIGHRFTNERGVKVEWPEYQLGVEHIKYFLPTGKPKVALELPFYTVWKTRKAPAAQISCTLETKAGKATVETEGSLAHVSPAIDEEAEELAQEEREEAEEGSEESEGSEGE
jgi:hypothetical protein